VHPDIIENGGGSISRRRFHLVRDTINRTGLGPYLERRLREHPGRPCTYRPTMLLAAFILAAMRNDQLEVTDALKALNSLSIRDRVDEHLIDHDGYFVGYRSFDHQFNRLTRALEEGWVDPDGTHIDTHVVVDAIIAASIPEDFTATAIAIDGTDVRTWAKVNWFEALIKDDEAVSQIVADTTAYDEDQSDLSAAETDAERRTLQALEAIINTEEQRREGRPKKKHTPRKRKFQFPISDVDGRPIPTRCPDARLAKRTATPADKGEFYAGFEMHTASAVRSFTWQGDPTRGQLGPAVPRYITGMTLCRGNQRRDAAAVQLIRSAYEHIGDLREVIVDRAYSSATTANLHEKVNELGLELVRDYTRFERERRSTVKVPVGRRTATGASTSGRTQALIRSAGSLMHEFTPTNYLAAPALPPQRGDGSRAAVEAYYNERAAYAWRQHSKTSSGDIRLSCPVHAGRLRPLNLTVATNRGKLQLPALDAPKGACCCRAKTISTSLSMRSELYQQVPYGTTAWSMSYGRRSSAETAHSEMRTGLARLQRGYFKVFGLNKATLLMGMMCVAINLQLQEQQHRGNTTETLDLDVSDFDLSPVELTDLEVDEEPRVDEPPGPPLEVDLTQLDQE
jgi:hypothetical protein